MKKRRVFVDMDGVVVDFDRYMVDHGLTPEQTKKAPGAYRDMHPIPGAVDAVKSLIEMGYDVWIATKPPTGEALAYSDKVFWILQHLPELTKKIIITHHKGLLGGEQDYLVDDRPHKASCEEFSGTLIRFVDGMTWNDVIFKLSK